MEHNPQLQQIIDLLAEQNRLIQQLLFKQNGNTSAPSASATQEKRKVVGQITKVKVITTRKGDEMAFVTIMNPRNEEKQLTVFPDLYQEHGGMLKENFYLDGVGRVENKNGNISCIMETLSISPI